MLTKLALQTAVQMAKNRDPDRYVN